MRRALGDLGVAASITVCTVALLLSTGGIWEHVGGGDLHSHLLPRYIESARAIVREHRLPLWNPYEYGGSPLLAEAQGLSLYVPAMALFATLPPYWALQGFYAFNMLVLACGCITYLRAHGLPRWSGALAALLTTAGVFNTPSLAGIDHPHYLAGVSWAPWILFLWERAAQRGVRPWLGLLACVLAAQWFTGYPVFSMDSAVLLAVVALLSRGATFARRMSTVAFGLALGAALAAIQLLPLAEAVKYSFRALNENRYAVIRNFVALGQTGMWRHQIFGTFGPGLPALALAALAFVRFDRVQVAWAAAALWACFALDPPLNLLYRLPPFSGVRYPLGWIHLLPLFTGLLAAAGASLLAERRPLILRALVLALVLATTVRAGRLLWLAPTRPGFAAPDYPLLAQRAPILKQVIAKLPDRPRFFAFRELQGGTALREHIASGVGSNPSMPPAGPRQLIEIIDDATNIPGHALMVHKNPRLARLLGIGVVAASPPATRRLQQQGFRVVGSLPPDELLLYQQPLPRVRVVDRIVVAPPEDTLARTVDADRDLDTTAVIAATDAGEVASVQPSPAESRAARILEEAPERIVVEARTAAPALLVLADTWDPGWLATLDERAVPILRADHMFRGVVLPSGTHRVEFVYRPASMRKGAIVSAIALGVTLLFLRPVRRS